MLFELYFWQAKHLKARRRQRLLTTWHSNVQRIIIYWILYIYIQVEKRWVSFECSTGANWIIEPVSHDFRKPLATRKFCCLFAAFHSHKNNMSIEVKKKIKVEIHRHRRGENEGEREVKLRSLEENKVQCKNIKIIVSLKKHIEKCSRKK